MPTWLIVLVLIVPAVVGGWLGLRPRLRKRVIVVTVDERTFEGVLHSRTPARVRLVDAGLMSQQGRTPIDGEVWLDRRRISWIQVAR